MIYAALDSGRYLRLAQNRIDEIVDWKNLRLIDRRFLGKAIDIHTNRITRPAVDFHPPVFTRQIFSSSHRTLSLV